MSAGDMFSRLTELFTVRRVYGEPIERDGVTVIPVAAIAGGGGGGAGPGDGGEQAGGGFGMVGRPVGVFVIDGSSVTWQPAVDVTKVVLTGQLVVLAVVLLLRKVVHTRTRRRR